MSKYTTEVRFICEEYAGLDESEGYQSVDYIISKARRKVFDFDYPIFDEDYRRTLETKILRHYYTREICEETLGLWKLRLYDKMNLIMPYYNKLYESELIDFDPLEDTNYTFDKKASFEHDAEGKEQVEGSVNSNATFESDSSTNGGQIRGLNEGSVDKYSDTPQGGLNGVESGDYLTNARVVDRNATENVNNSSSGHVENESGEERVEGRNTDTTRHSTTEEEYFEKVKGSRNGMTMAKRLMELRDSFLNIDAMVIDDLASLFFGLW